MIFKSKERVAGVLSPLTGNARTPERPTFRTVVRGEEISHAGTELDDTEPHRRGGGLTLPGGPGDHEGEEDRPPPRGGPWQPDRRGHGSGPEGGSAVCRHDPGR